MATVAFPNRIDHENHIHPLIDQSRRLREHSLVLRLTAQYLCKRSAELRHALAKARRKRYFC